MLGRLDSMSTRALLRALSRHLAELVEPIELPASSPASMRARFGSTPSMYVRCDTCGRLVRREPLGLRAFPTEGSMCFGLDGACRGRLWTGAEAQS